MEAKQFYNCSISPLVTKTFACKWSDDNRLSIISKKGVHVFEIVPALTQTSPILHVSRTFIQSPETLPGEFYINNILSGIFNWDKEDIYSFLMHDAYMPSFPKAKTFAPEIIDLFWSPQKLFYPHKCVLALITSAGAIDLAVQINKNWISVYEFTSVWTKIIDKELNDSLGNNKIDCNILRKQLNRLLATTATWSCLYYESDEKCFAYLVSAHRNSEIAIWKVYSIMSDFVNLDIDVNVELKFKKKLIEPDIKINTTLWVHLDEKKFLLIVGFFNGQIGTLTLQEYEGKIISDSYVTSYSEIDHIPVDFMQVLQKTKNFLEIIVIKGMHLIILKLDSNYNMFSMKFFSSPGFSLTGISIINLNTYLIATQDGNLYNIKNLDHGEAFTCEPVKIDISKNNFQYLSLTNSPNKSLFSLIISPSIMYDHLIDRDPSYLYCFNLFNAQLLDPLDTLYSNKEQSLIKYWDCLELIKINALKYNKLPEFLSRVNLDLESLSLHNLHIAFWIMHISDVLKKKNSEEDFKPSEDLELCKSYIFLHSASNYLNYLAVKENLTNEQKLSMSLLKNHLEIWLAGEEEEAETFLSNHIKKVLETISKFDFSEQEKCNFCDVIITEPWASSCSNGHKLPRCAITCLQVTCTKYRTCDVCNEIFHPCLDKEMSEIKCLYCDLPVFYKNQITESMQASKKNLSKRQPIDDNNKDSKEDESENNKAV